MPTPKQQETMNRKQEDKEQKKLAAMACQKSVAQVLAAGYSVAA